MKNIVFACVALIFLCDCHQCQAQGKLSSEQIINVLQDRHNRLDSINESLREPVKCDSLTTKITLEVDNDTLMNNLSYVITCTINEIEVTVFDGKNIMYRSTFEYLRASFSRIKNKVNALNIFKVDSYNDSNLPDVNFVLGFYKGNKKCMTIENYNHRSNAVGNMSALVSEIRNLVPINLIAATCFDGSEQNDGPLNETIQTALIASENQITFTGKGGDFKKINIKCDSNDWDILDSPNWVHITRNDNAIVVESTQNGSHKERSGKIIIGNVEDSILITVSQQ